MSFIASLQHAWTRHDSLVCVGLDPELTRLPAHLQDRPDGVFEFCRDIVDATADLVCSFKPQIAHFAALRAEDALERLIAHIHAKYPAVPVILDAKRGDIGSTAQHYVTEAFERFDADAVTLNPYLGRDSIQPFLDRADKGVILLCHTSNLGSTDLQELSIVSDDGATMPLYQHVARIVARDWNTYGNCALVTGATWPEQLGQVRALVGDMPLLVPGIGAQGGDVAAVLKHGCTADGSGLMINSSRAILYADDGPEFAQAARVATETLRLTINQFRA